MAEQQQRSIKVLDHSGTPAIAYAVAIIRPDGQFTFELSEGLKAQRKRLFTKAFCEEFLRSAGQDVQPVKYEDSSNADTEDSGSPYDDEHATDPPSPKLQRNHKRMRVEPRCRKASSVAPKQVHLGNRKAIREFYEDCLEDIQQNGCKILGKAWVKLLEPKKMTNYPYAREEAPPWWPLGHVRHKEPDHLHKRERLTLLTQILGLVVDHSSNRLPTLHKVTVRKFKHVTGLAMFEWFNDKEKPKNAEKKVYLDKLFYILAIEERHQRGKLDATESVTIPPHTHLTNLSDSDSDSSDSEPSSLPSHHQHLISPTALPTPSPPSPTHLHITTTASHSAASNAPDYPPNLLHRRYLPPNDYENAHPYDSHSSMHAPWRHHHQQQEQPYWADYTPMYPWATQPVGMAGALEGTREMHCAFPMSTSLPPPPPCAGLLLSPFLPPLGGTGRTNEDGCIRGGFKVENGGWGGLGG